MSALAGIWHWDGQSIAPEDLTRLSAWNRVAGADGGGGTMALGPSLVLQAHVLHFDRHAATETQPYRFAGGSVLTWDGRLDNRDDLLIVCHRSVGPTPSDSELVAAAYVHWGLEALPRLLGDWSLVLWDAPRRALILACDYMGNRALYYHATPARIVWATRLQALAAGCGLFTEPDEEYIASVLTTQPQPPGHTPFEGARRLMAGHQLVATRFGDTPKRYWTFEPTTVRARNTAAYADQLRALMSDAVRARLRATRRVWTHLSGGWDSSAVTCLAHILVQRGLVDAPAVQALSLVFPLAPESDETPFIRAVERWQGLQSLRRELTRQRTYADRIGQLLPDHTPLLQMIEAPVQLAGDHIVLTGELGDLIMGRSATHAYALLEPLHSGRILDFLRLAVARSRHMRTPLYRTLSKAIYSAYVPIWVRHARAQQYAREKRRRAAPGVTAALLARFPLRPPADNPSVGGFRRLVRPLVTALYDLGARGILTSPETNSPVWRTHPFTHRPLVEFVLAAPLGALWEPNVTRAGMKRALATILPPEILARSSKGIIGTALARLEPDRITDLATTTALPDDAAEWKLVQRGYVERDALQQALTAVRAGAAIPSLLARCGRLETWLLSLAAAAQHVAQTQSIAVDSITAHAGPILHKSS